MKLNGLDLNKINVFMSIVKHQGFKGAAEELDLTRSALSQSIASLETVLGVALFHRVGIKLIPTKAAEKFFAEMNLYQTNLQHALSGLIGKKGKASGTLRIGAYLEFAKSKMMPALEEFLSSHPNAQIKFTFDSPSRLDRLLESHKIDLSISVFPHASIHKVYSQKLYQEELVMVASSKLVPERAKAVHLHDIPVIDYYPSHQLFKRWTKLHFKSRALKTPVRAYAASADMVMEMVKRGLGMGVVPRYVFESSGRSSDVQVIQPSDKRLYDYIWLNEPKQTQKSLVHQTFTSLLTSRFMVASPP